MMDNDSNDWALTIGPIAVKTPQALNGGAEVIAGSAIGRKR